MKNFYVIKDDEQTKLYTNKEFELVQKYMCENPSSLLKGFYQKEDAIKFMNKPTPKFYYVVKIGRVPGIYTSRKELKEQVENFENALVLKTRDYQKAQRLHQESIEKILEERETALEEKRKKEKKNNDYEERMKNIRNTYKINDKYIGFIDCEASSRIAISIGLVVYDLENRKIVDKFYSLVCPQNFKKLETYVSKLTKLTTKMILEAPDMSTILPTMLNIVEKYNLKRIYSWGTSDRKYIAAYEKEIDIKQLKNKIENIQTIVSSATYEKYHNSQMGLESMKKIYHLDNEKVIHNALNDAIDLVNIYDAWFYNKTPDFNVTF